MTLFHSTRDTVPPIEAADRLEAGSAGRATLVRLQDAEHHPDMTHLAYMTWTALDRGG